jgi:hypothetical protein
VPRYRYRTAVLIGPWRSTPEQAAEDAVRARQAAPRDGEPDHIRWIVPGSIEKKRSPKG